MRKQFNVKDKSLQEFFKRNLSNYSPNDIRSVMDISAYHYLQDELIFKKDGDIKAGETVVFELSDYTKMSNKPLTNVYTYKAESYDDVSIKLTMIAFKIKQCSTT